MAAAEGFEIRDKVSKSAAKATREACTKLHYECVFVGEIACFGYGGRRPPTVIEAIAIPKNQSESKPSIGVFKRSMATQTTDVDGRFNITPSNAKPILSFEHNQYAGQGKHMVIKITIASDTEALDVQPLETMKGLQYARPEYILAHRLKSWIQAHTIKQQERSQIARTIHRKNEIDPLLKCLTKMRKKITKWSEFDTQHIIQYCTEYQASAATKLWLQVGLDPKLIKPSESQPVASNSSTPVASSASKPVASSAPKPVASSASKPVTPSAPKPVASSASTPVASSAPKPAASSASTPAAFSGSNPVASSASKPAASNASTPVASSASKPVASGASKPVATSALKPVACGASKPVATSALKPVASSASKPVASSSSTTTPPPAAPAATPSEAPPPYQADAATPTPSLTPSLSGVSTPKAQQQPAAPSPPSNKTPQIELIHLAAQRTIELLQAMSLPSAICGSLACFMYGNRRSPNDVEILVIPPTDCDLKVEEVKKLLVDKDPEHFLVVPATDPNADYNMLCYRLPQTGLDVTLPTSCNVELVFPGVLELPRVPPSMIDWSEGLPLIPFSVLLLQQLQSWDHHGRATEKLKVIKQKTVVEDLRGMFDLDMMEELRNSSSWRDDTLFTQKFLQNSLRRVREFCDAHPDMEAGWVNALNSFMDFGLGNSSCVHIL